MSDSPFEVEEGGYEYTRRLHYYVTVDAPLTRLGVAYDPKTDRYLVVQARDGILEVLARCKDLTSAKGIHSTIINHERYIKDSVLPIHYAELRSAASKMLEYIENAVYLSDDNRTRWWPLVDELEAGVQSTAPTGSPQTPKGR